MKNGKIVSSIIGGVFFGISFLGLSLSFLPSLGIGLLALVAGNLVFSEKKQEISLDEVSDDEIIGSMRKMNQKIFSMISKVESNDLKNDIKRIYETTNKIIAKINKNRDLIKKIRTFINYYLPVTIKILEKYDEIENQHLNTKDGKEFMKTVEEKVKLIADSFQNQLNFLYQDDYVDIDSELGVFENMLKSEGYTDLGDFNVQERGKNNG